MNSASPSWRVIADRSSAVFNIPSHLPFVDTLAQTLFDDASDDPLALTSISILLPTRRACRSLREAFLRLSEGRPLLLPRLIPLNDLDDEEILFASFNTPETIADIPPSIAPLKRVLLLARLIQARGDVSTEQAVRLAQELAKFLDQVQTEQLSLEKLKTLVPEDYAEHWQITLKFLGLLSEAWPKILEAEGAIDPADHRNRVFAAQAKIWATSGAPGPVIAAGSTGSIPATAELLAVVAEMKGGAVVLPGLDQTLTDTDWSAVDESHPQYGFKQLLARFKVSSDMVHPWPVHGQTPESVRSTHEKSLVKTRFLTEAMRPAATTNAWREMPPLDPAALEGLAQIDCPTPREEAEVISLIMRHALTKPEQTCALVTPDRTLAERVSMELQRWNIDIDDSAGRPLHKTPPGAFLHLVAAMVADDFAPVPTLAVCKHPLASGGLDTAEFRRLSRHAETELLRGPRPPAGLRGLKSLSKHRSDDTRQIDQWIKILEKTCGKFAKLMQAESASFSNLLEAHMSAAEALAESSDTPGALRLWADEAGDATSTFVSELAQHSDVLPPISQQTYPALFGALMSTLVVRPRFGKHPRLHILGPLEARLQRFDVLILAGLNEGTWPAEVNADPWMSRPMRKVFGLPSPERRIGLAAHDIAQALCGQRVVMTRADRVDGTPTVPSRWLMRLERAVDAGGLTGGLVGEDAVWLPWAREMTMPKSIAPISPPAPTPPVVARPRRLSVTEIETWMRDPYSIYARHVLGLNPLDPLDQEVSAADYGSLVHHILHEFIATNPMGPLPKNSLSKLLKIGDRFFEDDALPPGVLAFWQPRFERIAEWFIAIETERRETLAQSFAEIRGELSIRGSVGPFTLVGKADRIDRTKDGRIAVIDYKTGTPPSNDEVIAGFSPQLPLEAAMIAGGGFEGVPKGKLDALVFWHLHGRGDGGREYTIEGDATSLAANARKGLTELIAKFDTATTAYEARPNPTYAPIYSPYSHLARVKEWAAGEDET